MSNLAEAQAKVTHARSELDRLAAEPAKLGGADAEVAQIQSELDALTASAERAAAEWATAVIDGAPTETAGPPMSTANETTGAILRERLSEAKARAAVVQAARAPIKEKRDAVLWELRLAEERVEKAIVSATRLEAHRIAHEVDAALTLARDGAELFLAALHVLGEKGSAGLPALHPAADHLSVRVGRIESLKTKWQLLKSMLEKHDDATLEHVDALLEIRRHREQAAAQ